VPGGTEAHAVGCDAGFKPEEPLKTKLIIAFHVISAVLVSAFVAPPGLAQSAPGANPDLALLSLDLQTSRNSAASLQAQAEEKRKLKALAARETETAAPDEAEEPTGDGSELAVTIPTGGGLVPARVQAIVARTEPRHGSTENGSIETGGVPRTVSN
jgi:hypothetical protein